MNNKFWFFKIKIQTHGIVKRAGDLKFTGNDFISCIYKTVFFIFYNKKLIAPYLKKGIP